MRIDAYIFANTYDMHGRIVAEFIYDVCLSCGCEMPAPYSVKGNVLVPGRLPEDVPCPLHEEGRFLALAV